MRQLWSRVKSLLRRFLPLTAHRFEHATEALSEMQRTLTALEQGCAAETGLVKQSLEEQNSRLDSVEALTAQVLSLQDQLNQLTLTVGKLNSMEGVIHRRSDRLERCMIHCIPRAELSFEVALAEHCDLNCAGCDHFSPLAEPEFADFAETERDFSRLSELFCGHAKAIHLLGGEPLLNQNLPAFLKMAREHFPDAAIDITTNGLRLLNQPEEFWASCRDNNIIIRPTRYPIPLKFAEIERRAEEFGVQYRYFGDTGTVVKTSNHYRLDVEGQQDGSRNFLLCHRANTCVYLQHGRLYTCTVAPTVRHFNRYFGMNLKVVPEDSIDIYKANSAQEIMEFLAKPIPFCRYCMADKTAWNQPWHRSEKLIKEWT